MWLSMPAEAPITYRRLDLVPGKLRSSRGTLPNPTLADAALAEEVAASVAGQMPDLRVDIVRNFSNPYPRRVVVHAGSPDQLLQFRTTLLEQSEAAADPAHELAQRATGRVVNILNTAVEERRQHRITMATMGIPAF